jgi:hypothetical protein
MTTLGKLSRRDALGLLVLQALALSGCSFGVMAGKFLTGDPKLDAQFKSMTGVNLAKGKHKVVVVCTIPAVVDEDLSTLNLDIIEGVTRRMKLAGVDVISPDDVAAWIDENGGVVTDPSAMAQAFEADYIAWIDLQAFSIREENSANLLRGRVQGFVRAYRWKRSTEIGPPSARSTPNSRRRIRPISRSPSSAGRPYCSKKNSTTACATNWPRSSTTIGRATIFSLFSCPLSPADWGEGTRDASANRQRPTTDHTPRRAFRW